MLNELSRQPRVYSEAEIKAQKEFISGGYGTGEVKSQTEKELLTQVKFKLRWLKWLSKGDNIPERIKLNIIEVLAVIRFSDEKFPYLTVFNMLPNGRIKYLYLFRDNHYIDGVNDGLSGQPVIYPSILDLKNKPSTILEDLRRLSLRGIPAFAGTTDHFLVLGNLAPGFLKGKKAVFKI